ncbi:MAG: hypothetical protein KF836_13190 [Fimbriimonadaceae bacterium]|nr:hypothetical protein [Fimbriimonadaceae bacterium]
MVSLIAALLISPTSDLLESFSYEWADQLDQFELNCVVIQGKDKGEIQVELRKNGEEMWRRIKTVIEPLSNPSQSVVLRSATASGDRVLIIDINRKSWFDSYVVLCTQSAGYDFGFSYRNSRANVMEFTRDSFGMVTAVTTYDKFITGKPKSVKQNGEILDRWEQVKTHKLTSKGFQPYSTKYRLINVTGGGIPEKNYMWRSDWEKL